MFTAWLLLRKCENRSLFCLLYPTPGFSINEVKNKMVTQRFTGFLNIFCILSPSPIELNTVVQHLNG